MDEEKVELRKKKRSLKGKIERRRKLQQVWATDAVYDPMATRYVEQIVEEVHALSQELESVEEKIRR